MGVLSKFSKGELLVVNNLKMNLPVNRVKISAYLVFILLLFVDTIYSRNYTNGRLVGCEKIDSNSPSRIISYEHDGTDRQVLVSDGNNVLPSVSRDGKKIIFSRKMENGAVELFEMDMDGNNLTQITFGTMGGNLKAVYSPDGTKITCIGVRNDIGHPEVWIMDRDGSNMTKLTTTVEHPDQQIINGKPHVSSAHPSFTPDGQTIYYSATDSGDVQIWKMAVDGSNKQKLTDSLGSGYLQSNVPSVSLDGTKITHWSGLEGKYGEVWTMNPDGSGHVRHTTTSDPENSDDPVFSPDGKKIVYGSSINGTRSMYVLDIASGQSELVAEGIQYFSWQPLINSGVDDPDIHQEIAFYPNSFTGSKTVSLFDKKNRIQSVKIYTISGQLVRNKQYTSGSSYSNFRFKLSSGLYFLEVVGKEGIIGRERVVIQ